MACSRGRPGGDGQDQWPLLFLLAHQHFGLNLQKEIDAPAFTSMHLCPLVLATRVEARARRDRESAGAATIDELRARGDDLGVAEPWPIGRLSAVSRSPDGTLPAAGNPRE